MPACTLAQIKKAHHESLCRRPKTHAGLSCGPQPYKCRRSASDGAVAQRHGSCATRKGAPLTGGANGAACLTCSGRGCERNGTAHNSTAQKQILQVGCVTAPFLPQQAPNRLPLQRGRALILPKHECCAACSFFFSCLATRSPFLFQAAPSDEPSRASRPRMGSEACVWWVGNHRCKMMKS